MGGNISCIISSYSANYDSSYGIYNKNTGLIMMTGGMISCNSNFTYGIYNVNTGNVIITGGKINCSGTRNLE